MPRRTVKGLLVFFLAWAFLGLGLQAQPSTKQQIADLRQKLKETQDRSREDQGSFEKFIQDKRLLLDQKNKEKKALDDEISKLESKNSFTRQRARELQLGIDRILGDEKAVSERIRLRGEELLKKIPIGSPFERERRASVLLGLSGDIKAGSSTAVESLNRMVAFLDSEDLLAYDSQVIQTIEAVGEERLNVQLLRIGRVFFAVDTGPDVFLFRPGTNGFYLDTRSSLGVVQKRNIRQAILIIQGKQAPDLVDLPVWQESILLKRAPIEPTK